MPLGAYTSAAFTTATGVAVAANADIEVRRESDSALASIFSDRAGTLPITQPGFQADSEGRFTFFAAGISGGLQVKSTKGAETFTARHQATGTARELDADPFWATVWAAATKLAARAALGIVGAAAAGKVPIGDGTDFIAAQIANGFAIINGHLDWTVAASALTVAVKTAAGADPSTADPVYVLVRDPTAANGGLSVVKLTAATSVVVSSGSTLGTINSTAFRIWCVGFLDAGTFRLGVINALSGTAPSLSIYPLAGWGIASSTAEGGAGAADAAAVFYTGAAVASKPYATIGYATWEIGLATAGTWSAAPTRKQLFGPGVPLPGHIVQSQRTETGALATGTTTIPSDDTIPQSTEGNEYMSQAITPTSAANLLVVSAQGAFSNSATGGKNMIMALFQDAVANALSAVYGVSDEANFLALLAVRHKKLAATTSSTTLKIRAGTHVAGTTTFNGNAGARIFGGVFNSYLEAQEVMA